ncbi:MAG: hypothetical protein KME30_27415 [Iphinoe sp. HA4291-MV1]|jgi:hypothetical protein|nr:hypothetical protein [Iphinoe sp. HA4291-MV1]
MMTQSNTNLNGTVSTFASNSDNCGNKKQEKFFWMVTPSILREAYKQKKITAEFYIEGIIKCNKPGFVLHTTVRAFCKEWGIPERTFYRVISKLRAQGIIYWETEPNAPMKLWHGTRICPLDLEPALLERVPDSDDRSMEQRLAPSLTCKTSSATPSSPGHSVITVPPSVAEQAQILMPSMAEQAQILMPSMAEQAQIPMPSMAEQAQIPMPSMAEQAQIPMPSMAEGLPSVAEVASSMAEGLPSVAKSTAETQLQQALQPSYRELTDTSTHINQIAPLAAPPAPPTQEDGSEKEKSQEQAESKIQDKVIQDTPSIVVQQNKDVTTTSKPILKEQHCGAAREKSSQNLAFSDDPLNESAFLGYYKTYMKTSRGIDIVNAHSYVSTALSNDNGGDVEVIVLFDQWKDACRASERKISNYAEDPAEMERQRKKFDFESWEIHSHEGQYHTLLKVGLTKFCENKISAKWYEWALAKHPERFVNIPA